MNQNINIHNIKQTLLSKTYTLHHNGIAIESIFELENYKIIDQSDNLNFSGNVDYILDTEYGGGPVNLTLPFHVTNGVLELNLEEVDYENLLDWKEIASESNITNSYFEDEDDEDDEEEFNTEEYDYSFEEELSVN